jgi:hemerythrin superfamily protein
MTDERTEPGVRRRPSHVARMAALQSSSAAGAYLRPLGFGMGFAIRHARRVTMTHRTEELASKVLGTAKAAKATFEGLTGIFRHLSREHGEVSALLMRLKLSSDPDVRRELFPKVRSELLAHERAEVSELYTVLRQDRQTRAIGEAHDVDAGALEAAIDEVAKTAVDSPEWQPNLERLIDHVQRHVREEEHDYFPAAQQVFGPRANELLERYETAKAEALRDLKSTP